MNATLKALIVWLTLLVAPLQGFASVTQLWCAPSTAAQRALVHSNSLGHRATVLASDHHDATADAHTGDHASPHHHPAGKCGACASCCSGASMAPSFIAALPVHSPQFVSIPFDPRHVASVDLALPERPPRA